MYSRMRRALLDDCYPFPKTAQQLFNCFPIKHGTVSVMSLHSQTVRQPGWSNLRFEDRSLLCVHRVSTLFSLHVKKPQYSRKPEGLENTENKCNSCRCIVEALKKLDSDALSRLESFAFMAKRKFCHYSKGIGAEGGASGVSGALGGADGTSNGPTGGLRGG
eukprot:6204245-Pleurochrysis_carterae.AAC.1